MSVIEDFAKQLKNEVISLMNEKNINEVTLIDYNNTSRVTKIVSIVVKINRNWVALPVEKISLSEDNKIEFETTDDDETFIFKEEDIDEGRQIAVYKAVRNLLKQ